MVLINNNIFKFLNNDDDDDKEMTRLTLGPTKASKVRSPPQPRPHRRAPRRAFAPSEAVPAVYPWSEPRRAAVSSLESMARRGVREVRGTLQCKRCEQRFEASYDPIAGFRRLASAIAARKHELRDRAPPEWLYPELLKCRVCGEENSARPVVAEKKREINWLFLLLSGLLGCCTLEQLKYFCKHTGNHRTGAKDRVLYLAYLALCNQLEPSELFDPHRR